MILINILLAWMLADFIAGLVHWAQDRFLNKDYPLKFLNDIRDDNDLHHRKPPAILGQSLWGNINTTAPLTLPLVFILYFIGAPVILCLAIFFLTFANIVHRWSHTPRKKLNPVIRFFQFIGFFASQEQHWMHHYDGTLTEKSEANRCFCPMSDWVNPFLDRAKFFYFLDLIFTRKP